MQPTEMQVERTLAALRDEPTHERHGGIPRSTLDLMLTELPDGLLESLEAKPAPRDDRVQEVRDRIEHGDEPSDDELANRIVGRLVCDRLR
jgi:hypothetical protein